MKPTEFARYAFLTPDMYTWYFYIGPNQMSNFATETVKRTVDVKTNEEKEHIINKFYQAVSQGTFGALTRMLSEELINGADYNALVDKLENSNFAETIEMYKNLMSLFSLGSEESVEEARKNLTAALKEARNKKDYSVLKKLVKNAPDEGIWNFFDKLKVGSAKTFVKRYADDDKDIRYKKPENYDFCLNEIGGPIGNIALSILDLPYIPYEYYKNKVEIRAKRAETLEKIGAPDIIVSNEWRMHNEYRLYMLLADAVMHTNVTKENLAKVLNKFYSEECSDERCLRNKNAADNFLEKYLNNNYEIKE